ncbi:MAG: hypothetical protein CSB33_01970 [Desulfobacterales bacterium]|nr:MAG: hypothetical protein CSB33_01970 [Desulfobacterales bacterium]
MPVEFFECGAEITGIGISDKRLVAETGNSDLSFRDGTTGKLKEFTDLLEHYLIRLGTDKASEVVPVGDGALLNARALSKIMKKLKSCFTSNTKRMQYEKNRTMKLPTGSGVIESAVRRIVNMRVKAPGSFWKLDFVETVICLRSQALYGRWNNMIENWMLSLRNDFRNIATEIAI